MRPPKNVRGRMLVTPPGRMLVTPPLFQQAIKAFWRQRSFYAIPLRWGSSQRICLTRASSSFETSCKSAGYSLSISLKTDACHLLGPDVSFRGKLCLLLINTMCTRTGPHTKVGKIKAFSFLLIASNFCDFSVFEFFINFVQKTIHHQQT